jgi:hypothetical protein
VRFFFEINELTTQFPRQIITKENKVEASNTNDHCNSEQQSSSQCLDATLMGQH